MEAVSPEGGTQPLTLEDTGILTAVDDDFFENIYDVPFVTVNRIGAELHAEIILSGMKDTDTDRIRTALSVGRERGYRAYARVFGNFQNVLIYFSDSPSKGTIWAHVDELGLDWLK